MHTKRLLALIGSVAAVLLANARLVAQVTPDPVRTALTEATRSADLESAGTPAFRLTAKFDTFDFKGRPASSGTLKEEFLRPGLRKQTVRVGSEAETYAPEDNVTMEEEPVLGVFVQSLLFNALLHPGPNLTTLADSPVKLKLQKLGAVSLRCITVEASKAQPGMPPSTYCLGENEPLLRMEQQRYSMVVIFNKVVKFGGHTLAEDITIQQNGRVRGRLQVQTLTAAPDLQEADMPAPEPKRVRIEPGNGKSRVASDKMAQRNINKVAPIYPLSAKESHTQGTVFLAAIIGKDGAVRQLEVISAPSDDLADAAMQAVNQWRYSPYLVNGEPTEVDTTVTVHFMMR